MCHKPGEIAIDSWAASISPFGGLVGVLERALAEKLDENGLFYLISPGIIDSLVYHDCLVMEKPFELEAAREFEKRGLIRFGKQSDLIDGKLLRSKFGEIFKQVMLDWRWHSFAVMSHNDIFTNYLERNGLRDPAVDNYTFLKELDVEKLYHSIKRSTPLLDRRVKWPLSVRRRTEFWGFVAATRTFFYKVPVTFFDADWPPHTSVFTICGEILNHNVQSVLSHVLKSIAHVRVDLTQEWSKDVWQLISPKKDDMEVPLTLAILLEG